MVKVHHLSGGEDKDNDGIDDFTDADFVALPDSDDDSIVDTFDDDPFGTAFAPIVSGDGLTNESLPDTNFNGVADVFEVNGVEAAQAGRMSRQVCKPS